MEENTRLSDLVARTREQKHRLLMASTEAHRMRQLVEDENDRLRLELERLVYESAEKVLGLQKSK